MTPASARRRRTGPVARPRLARAGPGAVLSSLTARLGLGAGVLTLTALLAAGLAVTGVERTRDYLDLAVAAERRINHLSVLSSHIAGYGILRMEIARGGVGGGESQLAVQEGRITDSFRLLEAEYAAAVAVEAPKGLDQATATATRAMGLAQIRSAFEGMRTRQSSADAGEASMAQASGLIGPAVSSMIEEEYRLRSAAFVRIDALRERLTLAAAALALAALAAAGLFLAGVLRPTLRRLEAARAATEAMARGRFDVTLPEARDEFAPLFRETRALAEGLQAERAAVDRDRTRLNQIVARRTEELTAANRRLEALDADRQRFFADVSHELRTPLTVILSEAELARRSGTPVALEVIETRARRLMRRIEDLLRLSRSADGRLELEPVRTGLLDIAETVRADTDRRATSLGVALTATGDADLRVEVDPDWTRQIVAGLVDNALRHAVSGGRVALDVARRDGRAVLSVTDNGPGVPDTERIFTRFERQGSAPGFGIGLSFARWIVEEQGGTIDAVSPVPADLALGPAPGLRLVLTFPESPA